MVELEYYHFGNLNKSMYLSFNHQCLLMPQKERQPILCVSCLSINYYLVVVIPTHGNKGGKKNQSL